jgi:general secretion pathway protein F/type IV pilus assembly protein PilC
MQADSELAVVRSLDEKALYPVEVTETTGAARVGTRRVSHRELGVFYGQLADLLNAGVPLVRSLETLARATGKDRLRTAILQLRESITEGMSITEAAGEHPEDFPPLHVAMLRAGERGGFLTRVLQDLCDFLERQDELQSKIRGSLIYPAVLTVLGVGAMLFVLIVLVPQFQDVFAGMPQPLPTQVLFAVSTALVSYWHVTLLGLVTATVVAVAWARSDAGRAIWDRWKLRIPLVGKVGRTLCITRFCRILGTMLAGGVPILQALHIAKDAAGNEVLARSIGESADAVRAGEPLAAPLRESGLFPEEILEMIAVAEESNQLETVLVGIADTVDRRTNRQLDQAVRLIEPLILVFIAGAIGFIAMGLLYPIFTLSRSMQ